MIVQGGRLVAWGFNRNILDPYYYSNEPILSIHAEEAALKALASHHRRGDGRRYVLYVVRLSALGLAWSRPCSRCAAAIERFGKVKRVVHS